MQSNNNPSIDPANNDSLAGTLQFAFSKMLQNVNGMLPAKVISYDRTTNRVQVQLLIAILTTDGSTVSRQQLASLPVLVLGGGGFMLSFNLVPGDLGWVCANDRDISLFLQSYDESAPNTARKCSFSDGVFIPDVMRGYTINAGDSGNAVFQSTDGTKCISIGSSGITITAPIVTVVGALSATDGLSVGGGVTPFTVTGSMTLLGDIAVTGNITATGDITPHV